MGTTKLDCELQLFELNVRLNGELAEMPTVCLLTTDVLSPSLDLADLVDRFNAAELRDRIAFRGGTAIQIRLDDLSDRADTTGPVKISCTVEKGQLHTCHVGETFFALDPVEGVRSIDPREGSGRLIEELQTVAPKFEIPKLFWHNEVEDHGRLV